MTSYDYLWLALNVWLNLNIYFFVGQCMTICDYVRLYITIILPEYVWLSKTMDDYYVWL